MRYSLPPDIRYAVLWTIRGYARLLEQREEILEASPPPPDGQPGARSPRSPVDDKAVRLADITTKIYAIEHGWEGLTGRPETFIPEEYRKGIWQKIQSGSPFPVDAALNTYKLWKQRYTYTVAVLLHWL